MSSPNQKIHPAPEGFYWDLFYAPGRVSVSLRRNPRWRFLGDTGEIMGSFPFDEEDWEAPSTEIVNYVLRKERAYPDYKTAKKILKEALEN